VKGEHDATAALPENTTLRSIPTTRVLRPVTAIGHVQGQRISATSQIAHPKAAAAAHLIQFWRTDKAFVKLQVPSGERGRGKQRHVANCEQCDRGWVLTFEASFEHPHLPLHTAQLNLI